MMALMAISKTDEIIMAVAAILLLVLATFGLDEKFFRRKRHKRELPTPSQHIRYIVEEVQEESEPDAPRKQAK